MIKKSHLAPFKLAFYGLFSLYLLTDLCLCSGPLRKSLDRKLQQEGLSEAGLREKNAVAKVYGEVITKDELDTKFREELYLRGKSEQNYTKKELFEQKVATLNRMIEDALLRIVTKVNDLRRPLDQEKVDSEWNQFASRFPDEKTMDEALREQGINRSTMKMRIEARQQQEAQLNANIGAASQITEQELKEIYKELTTALPPRKQRQLSHIFFATINKEDNEVKKQAEEVLEQIKSGLSFEKAAAQYSQDPSSAEKGGQLGVITDERPLSGNLLKTVFDLPANEITLSRTPLGYHIFLASPIEAVPVPSYEEMRPELEKAQIALRRQTALDIYLDRIKAEARASNRITVYLKNV